MRAIKINKGLPKPQKKTKLLWSEAMDLFYSTGDYYKIKCERIFCNYGKKRKVKNCHKCNNVVSEYVRAKKICYCLDCFKLAITTGQKNLAKSFNSLCEFYNKIYNISPCENCLIKLQCLAKTGERL